MGRKRNMIADVMGWALDRVLSDSRGCSADVSAGLAAVFLDSLGGVVLEQL